ncbi:centlein-like isoform X2 [Ruditapes philippinarum]|uniref:centlein-like isoform X2 n=1 Tax=Ruditapes philippinarum TaxID=129788 RepID=UPI00295C2156|nr:centlein-like isoform X2 [Ruditapes philippinarum]
MVSMSSAADREISRLLEENRQVNQELKQCQADKDFVWSLWKKLQVSNPDVTQAVGLVVQREREKAEIRDRKVLEIIQRKDERIGELQANLAYKARELGQSTVKQDDVNDDIIRLQRLVDTLQDRNSTLELQLRNIEGREKNLENVHSSTIQDYEGEKREMSQKIHKLTVDLEKSRSEKADEMALRVQMESKVRVMEREVEQKIGKFEELVKELEEARGLLRRFESQARQQQQDLEYKNHELETVRKELAELWSTHNQLTEHSGQQADLIRQIQSLQTDTQKMMKNQEEAYSIESNSIQQMYTELTSRYDTAKKAESELRSNVLALKKELLDKDDIIADMQHRLDKQRKRTQDHSGSFLDPDKVEPVLDLEYKVKSMQNEIDNLRRQLVEKEGHIEQLEDDAINQTIEFDVARLNRHERTHSTPSRQFRSIGLSPLKAQEEKQPDRLGKGHRSRSMSPSRREQTRPRFHVQKDLEDCRAILKLKIRELAELKKAHQKRLERLKNVQENYKNVKEQLKALETEYYGSKKKSKKVKRADPKDLRHEDSTAVWNELAYFKNENRNLVVERMSLEEELDSLRVKASEDAATLHELKVTLEQEREERMYEKKKNDRNMDGVATQKSEIVLLKSEVQNKDVVIARLERDINDVRGDRDATLEEKRLLKQEIMDLKKEASQHRMDQADLRRDIQRLRRELEEEKSINKMRANKSPQQKAVTIKPAVKSRRKSNRAKNNNFNHNASKKFEELIEEGWEEMTGDSDTEEGTDNLGRKIVQSAQHGQGDSTTPDSSMESPQYRMSRTVPMKQTHRAKHATAKHIERFQELPPPARHTEARANRAPAAMYKDIATSPIACSPVRESTGQRKSPAYKAIVRQLQPMKQRVGYLQQQVLTLRESRAAALKQVDELKESNTQLQADLTLANQRQRVSKQSIQKLNNDLDKMHQDKKEIEVKLTQKMDNIETGHSEHDWKILDARLKSCSNELSRQNNVVRQLKQENEQLTDQVKILHDKVNRAERDSSQKRTLLEDQRSRVKQALESAKADADSLEQLETKMKLLQDTNEKQKIQIDSYKKRLGAVTREKREYEDRFLKLTAELEKKNKIVVDSQVRKQELETSLSEMEKLATQQMKSLARESEEALETAKEKLREIHEILQAYQRFVRNLAQEIVRRTQQTRLSVKELEHKKLATDKSNASMKRAQNLAKDILNLSQSDLDEIMSADGEHTKLESELESEKRKDKKWTKRVERTQNSKDDFAMALMDLFLQKMEERVELTSRLQARHSQSEQSLQMS